MHRTDQYQMLLPLLALFLWHAPIPTDSFHVKHSLTIVQLNQNMCLYLIKVQGISWQIFMMKILLLTQCLIITLIFYSIEELFIT